MLTQGVTIQKLESIKSTLGLAKLKVGRARSMRPSEKAMSLAEIERKLAAVNIALQLVKSADPQGPPFYPSEL